MDRFLPSFYGPKAHDFRIGPAVGGLGLSASTYKVVTVKILISLSALTLALSLFATSPQASAQISVPEDIKWKDITPLKLSTPSFTSGSGSSLKRTAANGATWDADAVSDKYILGDGYVEWRFNSPGDRVMAGLATANPGTGYGAIDFCFYSKPDRSYAIWESGSVLYTSAANEVTTNKVFRIEREGAALNYYVYTQGQSIGAPIRTTKSQGALLVDTSFIDQNAEIVGCTYYGPPAPEDVLWTSNVTTTADYSEGSAGSKLTSTAATASDATSSKVINGDGYVQFRFGQVNKVCALGLAQSNPDRGESALKYGIRGNANGTCVILVDGQPTAITSAYTATDVFRIERSGTTVKFYKNRNIGHQTSPLTLPIHTIANAFTGPLFVDSSFAANAAAIANVQYDGTPLSEPIAFTANVNTTVTYSPHGVQLSKNAGQAIGWNADAISTKSIVGSGLVSFSFGQTNKAALIGLADDNTNSTTSPIKYGICGRADGQLDIYENGVAIGSTGQFGSYLTTDVFTIRRLGSKIEYVKNGSVIRQVNGAVTTRLKVDTSFYEAGAAVTGCTYYGVPEDVVFRELSGAAQTFAPTPGAGSTLTRGATTEAYNAGGIGSRLLLRNGFLEFKVPQTTKAGFVGLSLSDPDRDYTTIDYSIQFTATREYRVWEKNSQKFNSSPTLYSAGDIFRIERVGTALKYYRNNVEFYPTGSTIADENTPLIVDTSLYHVNTVVSNLQLYWQDRDYDGLDDEWEYAHFGGLSQDASGNSDFDVFSNIDEFFRNLNPQQYEFDGIPTFTMLSGNNQIGPGGAFFPNALKVKLIGSNGTPLANAPIAFALTSGTGSISETSGGSPNTSLSRTTDANGEAFVFAKAQSSLGSIQVTATAGTGAGTASVVFTETTASYVDTPVVYPPGGTTARVEQVMIKSTAGATIYYTIDGTVPDQNSLSIPANTIVRIPASVPVNYFATKEGMLPSGIQTAIYNGNDQVAGAFEHSLYLKNGRVWAWGDNTWSQLPFPHTYPRSNPILVPGLSGITAISSVGYHSLALKDDKTVWAWGENSGGQLGNGTTTSSRVPVQVLGLSNITKIAAGGNFSVALREDGTVWAWGYNDYYQAGTGSGVPVLTPHQVNISGVVAISAGFEHALALKSDGTVWGWGLANLGQLGYSTNPALQVSIPVQATNLTDAVAISAGGYFSMALKKDGSVVTWGSNLNWETRGTSGGHLYTPTQIAPGSTFVSVAGGLYHASAIRSDGKIVSWGDNSYGVCAAAPTPHVGVVEAPGIASAIALSAGRHALALNSTGQLWSWGYNSKGQLGSGTTTNRHLPTIVTISTTDSDNDDLPDTWEENAFGNLYKGSAGDDDTAGPDGLTNLEEYLLGTNAANRDTDGDGVLDGEELATGLNPFVPTLVGHWKLDEASGTAASDSSGLGNNGTIGPIGPVGKVNYWTKGYPWKSGLELGGLGTVGGEWSGLSGLSVPNTDYRVIPPNGKAFTLAMWFRAIVLDDGYVYGLFCNENYQQNGLRIAIDWGGIVPGAKDLVVWSTDSGGSVQLRASQVIAPNRWYHLCVTYSGTVATVYLDGIQVGSSTGTIYSNENPIRFGGDIDGQGSLWAIYGSLGGVLDDIRVYQKALTFTEVIAVRNKLGDGDSLDDAWERANFGDLEQAPSGDWDQDGLSNEGEETEGTNPKVSDSDNDGLSDSSELNSTPPTNPLKWDTDSDGMPDGWEVANHTDVLVPDADGDPDQDGIDNLIEYQTGGNPHTPILVKIDGDESGPASGCVPHPFIVEVHDTAGNPLSGREVTFALDGEGSGGVSVAPYGETTASVTVLTGVDGRAKAYCNLHSEGERLNSVRAIFDTREVSFEIYATPLVTYFKFDEFDAYPERLFWERRGGDEFLAFGDFFATPTRGYDWTSGPEDTGLAIGGGAYNSERKGVYVRAEENLRYARVMAPSGQAFTMAMWFRGNAIEEGSRFALFSSTEAGEGGGFQAGIDGKRVRIWSTESGDPVDIRTDLNHPIESKRWYHLAVVYSYSSTTGANVTVYLDGEAAAVYQGAPGNFGIRAATGGVKFGAGIWDYECLDGTLDDLRIYHKAMSVAEVKGLRDLLTDGDEFDDKWEREHFGDLAQGPFDDFDEDGINNRTEFEIHTNPARVDTDRDGLPDGLEVNTLLTNPLKADSDGDDLLDIVELNILYSDPLDADTDSDGMPDGWEHAHGLDLFANDSLLDPDGDNVSNLDEYETGGNPHSPSLSRISSDYQSGPPNSVLAEPFEVEVRDFVTGATLSDCEVNFTVQSGGGTLSDATGAVALASYYTFTDAQGRAKAWYRQGALGNVQSVVHATIPQRSPVAFSAGTNALVGYWRLDEASGTSAIDSSGALNHGELGTLATWGKGSTWSSGPEVGGLRIQNVSSEGGESGLSVPNNANRLIPPNGAPFSIAMWFRAETLQNGTIYTLFSNEVQSNSGFRIIIDDSQYLKVQSVESGGTVSIWADQALVPQRWYHLAFTYSGGEAKEARVYLDGVLTGLTIGTLTSNTRPLQFGSGSLVGQSWNGELDDIRVYHKEVISDEIVEIRSSVTDGDLLGDLWEFTYFGDLTQEATGDWDGDGVSNLEEYTFGSNPKDADSDGDGLPDALELHMLGTNPTSDDTDLDQILDGMEDTDLDGMPDGWEYAHGTKILEQDAYEDPDLDTHSNWEEYQGGGDPHTPLVWTSGEDQVGPANTFLTNPYVLELRDQNLDPMHGATVVFTVQPGSGGGLAETNGGQVTTTLAVKSGANGLAKVWFKLPAIGGVQSVVHAKVSDKDPIGFTATTLPLVAHLRFEDAEGNVASDFSGAGNVGAIGELGYWTKGYDWTPNQNTGALGMMGEPFGGQTGLSLPYSSAHPVVPQTGQPFTMTMWFRANTVFANHHSALFTNASPQQSGFQIGIEGTAVRIWSTDCGGTLDLQTTPIEGQRWYHLAITHEYSVTAGAKVKVYLDGVLTASHDGPPTQEGSGIPAELALISNENALHFGAGINGFMTLDGAFDDIQVYHQVLSETEIAAIRDSLTDNDPLDDAWEREYFGDLAQDPSGDWDYDGAMNSAELTAGTDPTNLDSDGDGLSDGLELNLQTNPLNPDSDGDGLTDGLEYTVLNSNPNSDDSDGDGMKDNWEVLNGTEVGIADDQADPDGDGVGNLQEYINGTKPGDGDHDGLSDSWELSHFTTMDEVADGDWDVDGLTNAAEFTAGTDPKTPDNPAVQLRVFGFSTP